MKFTHRLFHTISYIFRYTIPLRFYPLKDDGRKSASFKLVYFCGEYGLNYLNASLISVYKNWKELPEIVIVSDGVPLKKIEKRLIKWRKKVELISWRDCAEYYKNTGEYNLYEYAVKDLWGKKFVSVMYCAQKFPTLYSDTDILWFRSPEIRFPLNKPILKMCQDSSHCYSNEMLEELNQLQLNDIVPLNAGLIFSSGNFSSFQYWKSMTNYLSRKPDNRTEQTSFAILNNHFNTNDFFKPAEILIKTDDEFSLKYTKLSHPQIYARHYVGFKRTSFWRDFVLMIFKKTA